jgi:hypothetical protein
MEPIMNQPVGKRKTEREHIKKKASNLDTQKEIGGKNRGWSIIHVNRRKPDHA